MKAPDTHIAQETARRGKKAESADLCRQCLPHIQKRLLSETKPKRGQGHGDKARVS